MYGVDKNARKLSWMEVTEAVRTEIESILGVFLKCDAIPDDSTYWDIQFGRDGIAIEQLYTLLKAVHADEDMVSETIPCQKDNALTTSSVGMKLAVTLLKRCLGSDWDHQLICEDALWLVGVRASEEEERKAAIEIDGKPLSLDTLKSKTELLEYLQENGASHSSLMDFCDEYREQHQNELCWAYPISDGRHLGTFLVLVKEGILSLPYDDAEREEYELFCLEDACLFRTAEEMDVFIQDWHSFDSDLRQAMSAMKRYLEEQEDCYEAKN